MSFGNCKAFNCDVFQVGSAWYASTGPRPCRTLVVGFKSVAFENFGFFSTGGGVLFLVTRKARIRSWEENINKTRIDEYNIKQPGVIRVI